MRVYDCIKCRGIIDPDVDQYVEKQVPTEQFIDGGYIRWHRACWEAEQMVENDLP